MERNELNNQLVPLAEIEKELEAEMADVETLDNNGSSFLEMSNEFHAGIARR